MNLDEMMKRMRAEYLSAFPERIQHLKDLYEKKDLDALQNEFHKLKGSGKTYGFNEISEFAGKIENVFLEDTNSGYECTPKAIEWLGDFLVKNLSGI